MKNGNKEWEEAMDTELQKIHSMWTFIDRGQNPPPKGYRQVTAHAVFDVKYDVHKRARLVGGGYLTEPSNDVSYCGIASLKNI